VLYLHVELLELVRHVVDQILIGVGKIFEGGGVVVVSFAKLL
jgi:hypothetical protein